MREGDRRVPQARHGGRRWGKKKSMCRVAGSLSVSTEALFLKQDTNTTSWNLRRTGLEPPAPWRAGERGPKGRGAS